MKDPLDRLTPLGVMVLGLLREGDMHPYEMLKLMRQRHDDRLVTITNGTLYHTVARLCRQGLLDEVGVDRAGNRPERTTYTLTDAGRSIVPEWVRRELPRTDCPEQFQIALAEAHNLDRDEVVELLYRRRAGLLVERELLAPGRRKATDRGVPRQYLIEIERALVLLEAELGWLDTLLSELDDHDFAWGDEAEPAAATTDSEPREAARR